MRLLLPLMFCKADELEPERLVIVANRLPVTCSKDAEGGWQLQVRGGMKQGTGIHQRKYSIHVALGAWKISVAT